METEKILSFQAEQKKMEFIDFEATEELNQQNEDLIFSDDENKVTGNFVYDTKEIDNSEPSFCRKFDNQVKDPRVAIYEESDDEDFLDTRDMNLNFMP